MFEQGQNAGRDIDLELDRLTGEAIAAMHGLAAYMERNAIDPAQASMAIGAVKHALPRVNDAARRTAHLQDVDRDAR